MKKILFLLLAFSFVSYAQVQKGRVEKYNGSTATYYNLRAYTNSQVDTTEFITVSDCDSVKIFFSSNDSTKVYFKLIYGDGSLSKVTASSYIDSLTTTTKGWKSLDWSKIVSNCGSIPFGLQLKLDFQATGNSVDNTARYSVYFKKYKK